MKVSLTWLREFAAIPSEQTGRQVADKLIRAGLEVETTTRLDADLSGPIVVGRVETLTELPGFKKPIRHCHVAVGEPELRSIVCGATNFAPGDLVVVSLPGAVLPGGFAIASRQTYGHRSEGMICSASELGLGGDHDGIMVLPGDQGLELGQDALQVLGLRDEVLDIAVTADRSYCLSVRGVAREAAAAYGVAFTDPAAAVAPVVAGSHGYPVQVEDRSCCPLFVALRVQGIDPQASSPLALQARVRAAGMRPISLAVDVTNLVMMELGQPLHAYDAASLQGPIRVRRAQPGEKVLTLDGVMRLTDPDDLLIADDSGAIGIAGVMGGQSTQISPTSTDIVLEAAHFAAAVIARSARRHKLPSEASRRFERGVDSALPLVAAARAAQLLTRYAGGSVQAHATVVGAPVLPHPIALPLDLPDRIAGHSYGPVRVQELLELVGCAVSTSESGFTVTAPTWRPDLRDPADLVEEVARLDGYDHIEPVLPQAPAGRGLTVTQRSRRQVLASLVQAGCVETLTFPFVAQDSDDRLLLEAEDPRRHHLRVANPLSRELPLLRTSLLPGLFAAVTLNTGRGLHDLMLAEVGPVFPATQQPVAPPQMGVDTRPSDEQIRALYAAVPAQPHHVGVVLCGQASPAGWWGPARLVSWADAVQVARRVASDLGLQVQVQADRYAPWHPGRCARLEVNGQVIGYAGQLHPRVVAAFDLPEATCAAELDLDAMLEYSASRALDQHALAGVSLSPFPASTQDVAVTVADSVPAAAVEQALRTGAGPLLEHIRLFDVYTGDQIPAGKKSLTFALRLRAPERTLTAEDVAGVREAALAYAAQTVDAVLRT